MCGIIASISKNKSKFNNVERVLQQFEKQRNRGTTGFGFISVNKKSKKIVWVTTKSENEMKEEIKKLKDDDILIFHHRIPTSSPNHVLANHPIMIENDEVLDYKYFIVHNGHIRNSSLLKLEHEKLGFKYSTKIEEKRWGHNSDFTDSESLGIELALYIERKKEKFEATGNMACFLLQVDKSNVPVNLFYYAVSNPVKFYENQAGIFFSSEGKGQDIEGRNIVGCLNLNNYKTKSFYIGERKKESSVIIINDEDNPYDDYYDERCYNTELNNLMDIEGSIDAIAEPEKKAEAKALRDEIIDLIAEIESLQLYVDNSYDETIIAIHEEKIETNANMVKNKKEVLDLLVGNNSQEPLI